MSGEKAAGLLCSAVHSGDMQLLKRLLRAGVDADSCDYDKRTALHIAAADGNLLAVCRLLPVAEYSVLKINSHKHEYCLAMHVAPRHTDMCRR